MTEQNPTLAGSCHDNRFLVVIPAHNEAGTISRVVHDVREQAKCDVLVVDDLSTDNTARVAQQAGALVIRVRIHLGAWCAVQTGLRYAYQEGYHYVVTMDGDGQHDAKSINPILRPVQSGEASVCIGLYLARGSRMRVVAWHVLRKLSGLDINDLTSGFRALDRSAIRVLLQREAALLTYQDVGVLMLLKSNGLSIREVEVTMHQRNHGISRIFHSWIAVFGYVSQTCLLCVAKISLSYRRTNRKPVHTANENPDVKPHEL